MKAREIRDQNDLVWNCVQAFTATHGEAAEKATQLSEKNNGKIEVICTPSGGAQTVRLELYPDWLEKLSDHDLVKAITNAR
jgi:hypothetical protein